MLCGCLATGRDAGINNHYAEILIQFLNTAAIPNVWDQIDLLVLCIVSRKRQMPSKGDCAEQAAMMHFCIICSSLLWMQTLPFDFKHKQL